MVGSGYVRDGRLTNRRATPQSLLKDLLRTEVVNKARKYRLMRRCHGYRKQSNGRGIY